MTGYIYDADGNRVAKGTITSWSCDPSANGFQTKSDYVLDQSGHQLSRFVPDSNGNIVLDYTNVWVGGTLMATYDGDNLHFYLNDWLGTRRVTTNYAGVVEQDCANLPYGDSETCMPEPAENLFTGKPRDAETAGGVSPFGANQGNDYFGARYYGSVTGRFLTPDWAAKAEPVPYAKLDNPQSLNLYSYVLNNPLSGVDGDGHQQCIGNNTAGVGCQKKVQQQAHQQKGSTKERLIEGISGVANLGVATNKAAGVVVELLATPVTGGASAAVASYESVQTVSQAGAGLTQIGGAISGNTTDTNKTADAMMVSTSILGVITLTATNGNLDTASKAAALEGLVSSSVTRSIFNSIGSMIETVMNIKTVAQPAAPNPPPPSCSVAGTC